MVVGSMVEVGRVVGSDEDDVVVKIGLWKEGPFDPGATIVALEREKNGRNIGPAWILGIQSALRLGEILTVTGVMSD